MSIRDDARQEAERRYPALNPDAEELTYPRSAIRRMTRGAFEAGAVWRDEQADRGCGHPNHEAEGHDCAPFLPDREPSEEAVERAAIAIGRQESCVNPKTGTWYSDVREATRDRFRGYARTALLAARGENFTDSSEGR